MKFSLIDLQQIITKKTTLKLDPQPIIVITKKVIQHHRHPVFQNENNLPLYYPQWSQTQVDSDEKRPQQDSIDSFQGFDYYYIF